MRSSRCVPAGTFRQALSSRCFSADASRHGASSRRASKRRPGEKLPARASLWRRVLAQQASCPTGFLPNRLLAQQASCPTGFLPNRLLAQQAPCRRKLLAVGSSWLGSSCVGASYSGASRPSSVPGKRVWGQGGSSFLPGAFFGGALGRRAGRGRASGRRLWPRSRRALRIAALRIAGRIKSTMPPESCKLVKAFAVYRGV
jgi:hypothetical protein